MRAASQLPSASIATPRRRAIAILAESPADIARLVSVVSGVALGSIRIAYRGTFTGFAPQEGDEPIDLVLLQAAENFDPRQCAAIEALTRRFKLVITGAPEKFDAVNGVPSARAWSFVNQDDLSASALDNAILSLERARQSEDRLLRALGEKTTRLRRIASAANLIPPVVERVESAIWQLAGLASATSIASEAGDAAARAFDVVDELEMLNSEFAECLKMTDCALLAPRAADLNEVVENFARDCFAAGFKSVSAQTGSDPIVVKPSAADLRQLLDALLHAWREVRQPNDKLEFLTWDSGCEARLAIVLAKSSGIGGAEQAPAHITMRNIFRNLHPLAQACGASVEAGLTPDDRCDFASMTLCLPKQTLARANVVVAPRNHDATLEEPEIRDRAG